MRGLERRTPGLPTTAGEMCWETSHCQAPAGNKLMFPILLGHKKVHLGRFLPLEDELDCLWVWGPLVARREGPTEVICEYIPDPREVQGF